MKINQFKAGVILSYATQGINILSGLIYTPIMLRLLGQSEYGLYQLVYSVVSYLSLLSLGFGASYVRFYSRYKVQNNENEIAKLNGMFMTIFAIISAICILCGAVMVQNAKGLFGDGLTIAELSKARILLAIMIFNMAITFIDSVFVSIITAHEKFFFQKALSLLRALFNPFLTLPLLFLGYGSVAIVFITTMLTVVVFVLNCYFCLKELKVKFVFSTFDFSLFKEMWGFTFFIFINMIVDQINWNVGKFLLGRIIGTMAVAVFGVATQLNNLYLSLSTSVSNVFLPRVNFIVEKNSDNNALSELFIKVGRIQLLILGPIITGYIIFGKQFIRLWAGAGYDEAYIIGLFLMIPVTVPLIQNLGIEIQRAKNMHKIRAIAYSTMAIANIFISIPCIKKWGASGAAIGTAISLVAGNIIFMNWYYYKRMGLNIPEFWKSVMPLLLIMIGMSLGGGIVVKSLTFNGGLISFVVQVFCYSILYCAVMWILGMNKNERNIVLIPARKIGDKIWKR